METDQIDFELELDMQNQVVYTPQTRQQQPTGSGAPSNKEKEWVNGYEVGFVYYVQAYENGNNFVYRISELIEKSKETELNKKQHSKKRKSDSEFSSDTNLTTLVGSAFEIRQSTSGQRSYKCNFCSNSYDSLKSCKEHFRYAHSNVTRRKVASMDSRQSNSSNYPGTLSSPSSSSSSPVPSFHSTTNGQSKNKYEFPHHCKKCGQGFNYRYKLKKHIEKSNECLQVYKASVSRSKSKSNIVDLELNGHYSTRKKSRINNDESS